MLVLDVEYVFTLTGGPQGLMNLLAKYDPVNLPKYPTIQMWRQRGSISGVWLIPLIYAMQKEGVAFEDLLMDDDELAAPPARGSLDAHTGD